jgi:signal transduction histidine kinase
MGRLQEEKAQREALMELSESLKASNARLNEAQQMARIGSWTWDIVANHVSRSDEFYNILQRDPSELNSTPQSYLQWLHPDDREIIDHVVQQCVAENRSFSYEARAVMPNQTIKTIFAQGKAVTDAEGHIVKMSGTIQDITERKAHEQTLEKTNQDLIKSNHELDKFVYSVSHDLRAPLLSMQGIVEITEEYTEEELTALHMTMLKGSIGRLDLFIGDILNYSRNARGEISLVNIDFQKVLLEISHDLKFMSADSKKVDIQLEIDQQGDFYSDNGRLRIIINNLISNSIRYHDPLQEKPFVRITAKTTESTSCIEVEDNGIGIPEAYHQKVFEMFSRVSENSTGSGLGLYIVRETVDKLKGEILMESQPGKGTKFTLNLPNLYYQ